MFLNVLSQEEKVKCMELFCLIVNIDGNYSEEEQLVMENYKIELGLDEIPEVEDSLEELIDYFSAKSKSIKKMLCFEIYGLILADKNVAIKEQNLLEIIDSKFHIEKEKLTEIKNLVTKLQTLYEDIFRVLA